MKKIAGIVFAKDIIRVGDFYEDCSYHPVLCTESDYRGDNVGGVSLFDGSEPRSCSIIHCAPRKLTAQQVAFKLKRRERWLEADRRWRATQDNSGFTDLLQEENNTHAVGQASSAS